MNTSAHGKMRSVWCVLHSLCREYLLATLLHLTVELLRGGPPRDRDNSLAANLAAMLLKVLACHL